MQDYHKLENEILTIFRNINADENNKEISKLLGLFQKYWKSYQDNWPGNYWEIYNLVYDESVEANNKRINEENKNNELLKNNLHINQFKINDLQEGSIISEDDFKNGIEQERLSKQNEELNQKNNFLLDDNSHLINNSKLRSKKFKNNVTKDQTKSLTNLDDIDKELDGLLDKSIIKDVKDEKNRHCLDCNIL